MEKVLYVIAHNIRSAHNVGAILRTSDGAGVKKVYLTGYSPIPYDSKRDAYPAHAHNMIAKTALGAENFVSWEKHDDLWKLIEEMKSSGIRMFALEKNSDSLDFREANYSFPCALILGEEIDGVSAEILNKCDKVISIPMKGKKESLNVSVAAGIAIYEILK